ncbi:prephenate dehydrogenase [Planctomonas psychrotolerans]|uniref:prephenate dehydrogenase n=1 Tax=Planctomonas psychrotolerans TaxID=2528712 RepID=UPI001238EC4B|nr:prephenate dehydrogenase [Planctomonas psychrotolerans]
MTDSRLAGVTVRVVGTGLLGTSVGLGLRARGVDVVLDDASPAQLRLAIDYGAGRATAPDDAPALVVVCVPPDVTARTVAAELSAYPDAIVTDVASVKVAPLEELAAAGADLSRYLGSHPLAGRERGGAVSGRADLFLGRPWVVAGHDAIPYRGGALVEDMILDLGAVPLEMTAEEHDRSVALTSHVPQLVATLMASRLVDAPEAALGLVGQGIRDVTRVAASAPELWLQILGANSAFVAEILRDLAADATEVVRSLDDLDAPGARRALAEQLAAGNTGVARLPGKHGQDRRFSQVIVMVNDTPGQLARLLTHIGEIGVNLEDLRIEHSPGAQIGLAEIGVLPEVELRLTEELASRGWRIAG